MTIEGALRMPDQRYEMEAEKILAQIDAQDSAIARQMRHLIAQALETAEKRGREMSARLKESSG